MSVGQQQRTKSGRGLAHQPVVNWSSCSFIRFTQGLTSLCLRCCVQEFCFQYSGSRKGGVGPWTHNPDCSPQPRTAQPGPAFTRPAQARPVPGLAQHHLARAIYFNCRFYKLLFYNLRYSCRIAKPDTHGRGGAGQGTAERQGGARRDEGGAERCAEGMTHPENRRPAFWMTLRKHARIKSHINRIQEHDNRLTKA